MRLWTVVWLSALGMALTSALTAWLTNPTPEAHAASPPEPVASPPTFTSDGAVRLEARVGHAAIAAGSSRETYLYFRAAAPSRAGARAALHLGVLIDRSGSMRGSRLANALSAARATVRRLRAGDRVTVMTYDSSVATLVPTTQIVDDASRSAIVGKIVDAPARGSTCISCALEAGIRELEQSRASVTHLLLLSDGEATAGEKTLDGFRRIARGAREGGIGISSIGVDVDYNEALLSTLATLSNGRHHFVRDPSDLERAFDREIEALSEPVATDAVLDVSLPAGVELVRVFDRDVEQNGDRLRVRLGTFSAGSAKTLLLAVRLAGVVGAIEAAEFSLSYVATGAARTSVEGSLGVRIVQQPSEASELDPAIAVRIGASRTGSLLFDAGRLYKTGAPADFAELDGKLQDELARVERDRAALNNTPTSSSSERRALERQRGALSSTRSKLIVARGAQCACPPGDLQCAMRCTAAAPKRGGRAQRSCQPGDPLCADLGGELSNDEKAAAKDSVGESNHFKE